MPLKIRIYNCRHADDFQTFRYGCYYKRKEPIAFKLNVHSQNFQEEVKGILSKSQSKTSQRKIQKEGYVGILWSFRLFSF